MSTTPRRSMRHEPRFFSVLEIADALGVCTKTVRRRIADGELRHHRVGSLLRVSEEDFNSYIAARRA